MSLQTSGLTGRLSTSQDLNFFNVTTSDDPVLPDQSARAQLLSTLAFPVACLGF